MDTRFSRTAANRVAALTCLLCLASAPVAASKGAWEEYGELVKSSETISTVGPTLFGDQVSLQHGGLSFSVTDVSLRGNNALPVALTRTFRTKTVGGAMRGTLPSHNKMDAAMGDWDIELPNIGGVFADAIGWVNPVVGRDAFRCSAAAPHEGAPRTVKVGSSTFEGMHYWSGTRITIPGASSQGLLFATSASPRPTSGNATKWITSDWTSIGCLPSILNGAGEGFIATTANGTRYWFNWMSKAHEQELTQQKVSSVGFDHLPRGRYALYATRAEDRFGNWVSYRYANTASEPMRLAEITSSDGRRIEVGHNASGFVHRVRAGDRTWTYGYSAGTGALTSVRLPDGSAWTINLAGFQSLMLRYVQGAPGEAWRNCGNPGDPYPHSTVGTVTHPSGAVGQFTLSIERFRRSGIDMAGNCATGSTVNPNDVNDDTEWIPTAWDAFALQSKQVSGPSLATARWDYDYGMGAFTEVTGPTDFTRQVYGTTFRHDEGKLLLVERGASPGEILQTTEYVYELSRSGMPYPSRIGISPQVRSDDFADEYPSPQKQVTVRQQGAAFVTRVDAFDALARAITTSEASSLGFAKTEATAYFDDTDRWILGQVARSTTNGIETSRTQFNGASLPWKSYVFRKLQQVLTYHLGTGTSQDGTLASVEDGNGNTIHLGDWKRGTPGFIRHPATPDQPQGVQESAVINDAGWLESVTDANGYQTCYRHDPMGRVEWAAPPSEAASGACDAAQGDWESTTARFDASGAAVYGLPQGHWQHVRSTGNSRTVVHYDAMWRPVVEETFDDADAPATRSITVKRYDPSGRLVFQSYPRRELVDYAAELPGTVTRYDALDRVTGTVQDSELGLLRSSVEYLDGFRTRTTSARGQSTGAATLTTFMAFGKPETELPVAIAHPEQTFTRIERDVFGKPTLLQRSGTGSVRTMVNLFAYDQYQRLCKRSDKETGSNALGYDDAGNLLWSASGLPWSPDASCLEAQQVASVRVDRRYDARNRLLSLAFPDHASGAGNGNQAWRYYADGLPSQVSTWNIPAPGVSPKETVNTYVYNHRRMLTTESVAVPGWYSYSLHNRHDRLGNLAGQGYPSGYSVDYAPNALGQPTQVVSPGGTVYASNVSYFPNGAIARFAYGNGVTHAMAQNLRQLPSAVESSGGVLKLATRYDANGNVAGIDDLLPGGRQTRTMQYDDLDRLERSTSPMFGLDPIAEFGYDALDNLTRMKVSGRDAYYCYGESNRLDFVRNGPDCSASPATTSLAYDDRGNVTSRNATGYSFDLGNRLRIARGPGMEERYRYDAHGRRVLASKITGVPATIGVIFSHYANNGQLMHQINERPESRKAIDQIYLGGSLIAQREMPLDGGAAIVKYQHTDALGSPVATTNQAGTVIERTEHEPYGKVISGNLRDGPGYTGHVLDNATGLNYMQQRYYDPEIGRFLSVDPITTNPDNGANFNRYWYANNNPYKFVDPDGREVLIAIDRDTYTTNSVGGTISVSSTRTDKRFSGYTLEDSRGGRARNKDPLKADTYDARVRTDGDRGYRIELESKNDYQNVQIHVGNTAIDVEGCFAAGTSRDTDRVNGSKEAMKQIQAVVGADGSGKIRVVVKGAGSALGSTAPPPRMVDTAARTAGPGGTARSLAFDP